jgi:hypothetical protein
MKIELPRNIFEKFIIRNFMKIRQVGAKLFQTDGGTDGRGTGEGGQTDRHMTKTIVDFRNFANETKNTRIYSLKSTQIFLKLERKFRDMK